MKLPVLSAVLAIGLAASAMADEMKMAVTTSFHNSGLSEILLPAIEEETGITVELLVVGTGQALRLGEAGDVDAILVHSRAAEDAFVEAGYGTHRREIMYNDFVLIGPEDDPASVAEKDGIVYAMQAVAAAKAPFVSRGDESGTHKRELDLWELAEMDIPRFGDWYRSVGAGMGAALNTASGMNAYILSDRASWLNFGNKGDLAVLFEGDAMLFNQYAYIPVDPERHEHVKADLTDTLEAWLVGESAAALIDGYTIEGEKLFTFNAQGS